MHAYCFQDDLVPWQLPRVTEGFRKSMFICICFNLLLSSIFLMLKLPHHMKLAMWWLGFASDSSRTEPVGGEAKETWLAVSWKWLEPGRDLRFRKFMNHLECFLPQTCRLSLLCDSGFLIALWTLLPASSSGVYNTPGHGPGCSHQLWFIPSLFHGIGKKYFQEMKIHCTKA